MLYPIYELNHAIVSPFRAAADLTRLYYKNPLNPLAHTAFGKQMVAGAEVFERVTRRYGKPSFDIERITIDGGEVDVDVDVVWERPFCRLLHFNKRAPKQVAEGQPTVLVVAPLSGHYATLLRGTVDALLPDLDVYITDWVDARMVPLVDGRFDLDTYIEYLIKMFDFFRGDLHVIAVCQPAVPVFAAISLMEANNSTAVPKSMTLMGGPIDTRVNPTAVSRFTEERELDWFRRNVIMKVPFPNPGFMRSVYPGFLQLSGFMAMNFDRHVTAHREFYNHLVEGDGDSADKHREFYDEYMSVMDLPAEFYLQTIDTVFKQHALPKREMVHNGRLVDPSAIRRCALFTIEGEKDDISGVGQTKAAHDLAANLPAEKHRHYEQPRVGHYGVFNGSRFRNEIAPRIKDFIADLDKPATAARPTAAEPSVVPMRAANGAAAAPTERPAATRPRAVTAPHRDAAAPAAAPAAAAADAAAPTEAGASGSAAADKGAADKGKATGDVTVPMGGPRPDRTPASAQAPATSRQREPVTHARPLAVSPPPVPATKPAPAKSAESAAPTAPTAKPAANENGAATLAAKAATAAPATAASAKPVEPPATVEKPAPDQSGTGAAAPSGPAVSTAAAPAPATAKPTEQRADASKPASGDGGGAVQKATTTATAQSAPAPASAAASTAAAPAKPDTSAKGATTRTQSAPPAKGAKPSAYSKASSTAPAPAKPHTFAKGAASRTQSAPPAKGAKPSAPASAAASAKPDTSAKGAATRKKSAPPAKGAKPSAPAKAASTAAAPATPKTSAKGAATRTRSALPAKGAKPSAPAKSTTGEKKALSKAAGGSKPQRSPPKSTTASARNPASSSPAAKDAGTPPPRK